MRGRIAHKLRSEQGASMSMALLLFLVCAIVSSIVIGAASAAAGRMSELSEMDRQYYNVTSAVRLISGQINKSGKVQITQIKEADSEQYFAIIDSLNADEPASPLTLALAKYMVFGTTAVNNGERKELTGWSNETLVQWWNEPYKYPARSGISMDLDIYTLTDPTNEIKSLSTAMKVKLNNTDGSYTIEVSDATGGANAFQMSIGLAPVFIGSDEIGQPDGSIKKQPTVTWKVTKVTRGLIA